MSVQRAIEALHEIWKVAGTPVLNDEDAQQRHQRIYDIAHDALADLSVLERGEGA